MILQIKGLNAGLLPHREWVLHQWFYSERLHHYYYPTAAPVIRYNFDNYEELDPEISPLCRVLHEHGIGTTPSCQGHFRSQDWFAESWEGLRREQEQIQGQGLILREASKGGEFVFREIDYNLPWRNYEEYLVESSGHQRTGFFGFVLPPERRDLYRVVESLSDEWQEGTLCQDMAISRILGVDLFIVFNQAESDSDRVARWKKITELFRESLDLHPGLQAA